MWHRESELDRFFGTTQAQENGRKIARMACGLQDTTKSREIMWT
jgi:hypothetical protein